MPLTPGFEVAGTVVALGEDIEASPEGTRVAAVLESGGYAKDQTLSGFGGSWICPGRTQAARGETSRYLRNDNLRVVRTSFPLAEAVEVHRAIEGRATVGKLTLLT